MLVGLWDRPMGQAPHQPVGHWDPSPSWEDGFRAQEWPSTKVSSPLWNSWASTSCIFRASRAKPSLGAQPSFHQLVQALQD